MEKNKRPRNIKFNKFSILNFSFGLNVLFVLEKLNWVTFKSGGTLFFTVTTVFLLRALFDLLLAFFRQKDPTELRSKNTKHRGWYEALSEDDSWGVFAPIYSLVVVFIFVVAVVKLEWLSISNTFYDWALLVLPTCIAFEQYWYFYNDFPPPHSKEQSPE